MQLVFIIFGIIIVLSFITGIILTIREKKKNSVGSLTDDPKMLFSDEVVKTSSSNVISVENDSVKETKVEPVIEKISDSEGFDLPTNHDYNSHKFVVSSTQESKDVSKDISAKVSEPPVVEPKNTTRFIYNEEEII